MVTKMEILSYEKKCTHSVGDKYIECTALSPTHLFVANASYNICMFHLESGELDHEFVGHLAHVNCMSLSGAILATASHHDTIRVWNVDTRKPMHEMNDYSFSITCLELRGAVLCAGSYNNYACAWNALTGQILDVHEDHQASVTCLSISPSSHFWVTGSDDCTISIKSLKYEDKKRSNLNLIAGRASMTCLDTTDEWIVGGTFDGIVYLWDAYTANVLQTFGVHTGVVHKVSLLGSKILSRSAAKFFVHDGHDRTLLESLDKEDHTISDYTYANNMIFVTEHFTPRYITNKPMESSDFLVHIGANSSSSCFIPHGMRRLHASRDGKYIITCSAPHVTVYRIWQKTCGF